MILRILGDIYHNYIISSKLFFSQEDGSIENMRQWPVGKNHKLNVQVINDSQAMLKQVMLLILNELG